MGNLIVKDNALIEASHKLSEVEQRLVLLAILKARSVGDTIEQLKDKTLTIHADDYTKTFGVDRDASYLALKKAVLGLYRAEWGYKYIDQNGEHRVRYERFTQSADYGYGSGSVKFMFSTAIIPMLVQLERNFTSYEISQVANLSGRYSMRLFEFLIQHFNKKTGKGWLDVSLDDLRFRFGLLPTEYTRMCDFKRYVLDFGVKQINENTDLDVTYIQKKQGRNIVGFRFDFSTKKSKKTANAKAKNTINKDDKMTDIFGHLTKKEKEIIQKEINLYVESKQITDQLHIDNITKKAVKEKWGVALYELEQEQKRLEKEQQEKIKLEQQKILENLDQEISHIISNAEKFVKANIRLIITGYEKQCYARSDYEAVAKSIIDNFVKDFDKRKNVNFEF